MSEIITNFFQQIISTFGVIAIFGLLFSLCRKGFCKLLGNTGVFIINYVFGIVGTPIHELSHAIFCLLFGHKITEIDLFSPGDDDDSLGYVAHDYDDDNLFHKIGLFFIGVGPVLGGSTVILILMYYLVPNLYNVLMSDINQLTIENNYILNYVTVITNTVPMVFNEMYFPSDYYWVFLVLALMIASHMELSASDISGAKTGLFFLMIVLFVVDAVMYMIDPGLLQTITIGTSYFGLFMAKILIIGAIFNVALLVVALFLRVVLKIFR